MSAKELKELCKNKKIKGWYDMNKEQMIDALENEEVNDINDALDEIAFPELNKKEFEVFSKILELGDYKEDGVELSMYTRDFIEACKLGKGTMKKRLESLADKGLIVWENRDQRWKGGTEEDSYFEFTDLGKDFVEAFAAGEIKAPEKKVTTKGTRDNSKRKQIEYNGKSQHICAWARELGINANTLYNRIYKMNWPIEKAFESASARAKKDDGEQIEANVEE